jgi:hypothetical protein
MGEDYDEPEPGFVQSQARGRISKQYEKKIKTVLNTIFRATVAHPGTVPDAAAIIMYGPAFAEKWGNLAEADKRVRKGIDMVLEGAENPYLAAMIATAPLLLQAYRNHEDALSPSGAVQAIKQSRAKAKEREPKRLRIPFTKRYVEFRWRLNVPAVKNMTNDPDQLAAYVFNNEEIIAAMRKAGIETIGGVNLNGSADQRAKR